MCSFDVGEMKIVDEMMSSNVRAFKCSATSVRNISASVMTKIGRHLQFLPFEPTFTLSSETIIVGKITIVPFLVQVLCISTVGSIGYEAKHHDKL